MRKKAIVFIIFFCVCIFQPQSEEVKGHNDSKLEVESESKERFKLKLKELEYGYKYFSFPEALWGEFWLEDPHLGKKMSKIKSDWTKQQVAEELGSPTAKIEKEDVWVYESLPTPVEFMRYEIKFSKNKVYGIKRVLESKQDRQRINALLDYLENHGILLTIQRYCQPNRYSCLAIDLPIQEKELIINFAIFPMKSRADDTILNYFYYSDTKAESGIPSETFTSYINEKARITMGYRNMGLSRDSFEEFQAKIAKIKSLFLDYLANVAPK